VRLILLLILPAFVLMLIWHQPIVRLVYERGAFAAQDTQTTSLALVLYALQLPLTALDQLFIFAYYARKNTRTPVLVGMAGIGLYLATALPLLKPLGMPGLVLANTVQNSGHSLIMLVLLTRLLGSVSVGGFSSFLLRVGAGTGAISAVAWGGLLLWQRLGVQEQLLASHLVLVVGGGVLLGLTYVAILAVLRTRELSLLVQMVPGRLRRRLPGR